MRVFAHAEYGIVYVQISSRVWLRVDSYGTATIWPDANAARWSSDWIRA